MIFEKFWYKIVRKFIFHDLGAQSAWKSCDQGRFWSNHAPAQKIVFDDFERPNKKMQFWSFLTRCVSSKNVKNDRILIKNDPPTKKQFWSCWTHCEQKKTQKTRIFWLKMTPQTKKAILVIFDALWAENNVKNENILIKNDPTNKKSNFVHFWRAVSRKKRKKRE